jgi:hypothetical protein
LRREGRARVVVQGKVEPDKMHGASPRLPGREFRSS